MNLKRQVTFNIIFIFVEKSALRPFKDEFRLGQRKIAEVFEKDPGLHDALIESMKVERNTYVDKVLT